MEYSAFGHGTLSNDIPIELNRFVNYRCKLPDDKIQVGDMRCLGALRVAQGNLKDALSDGQLVHGYITLLPVP